GLIRGPIPRRAAPLCFTASRSAARASSARQLLVLSGHPRGPAAHPGTPCWVLDDGGFTRVRRLLRNGGLAEGRRTLSNGRLARDRQPRVSILLLFGGRCLNSRRSRLHLAGEFTSPSHILDGADIIAFANVGTTTTVVGRGVVRIQYDGLGVVRDCSVNLTPALISLAAVVIRHDVLAIS